MKFPETLKAVKAASGDQWAIGDALIEEVGEPGEGKARNGATPKFEACAAELAERGYEYEPNTLRKLRDVAGAFPHARQRACAFSTHEEARTPEVLAEAIEEFGPKPSKRQVRAFVKAKKDAARAAKKKADERKRREAEAEAAKKEREAEEARRKAAAEATAEAKAKAAKAEREAKAAKKKVKKLPPPPTELERLRSSEFVGKLAVTAVAAELAADLITSGEAPDEIENDFAVATIAIVEYQLERIKDRLTAPSTGRDWDTEFAALTKETSA